MFICFFFFRFDPPPNSQDAHSVYWGHSFQRMMTSSSPDLAKLVSLTYNCKLCCQIKISVFQGGFDDSERVDCRETYSVVYRSDIIKPDGDRIKLLYSSEIKAIDQSAFLKRNCIYLHQCHLSGKVYRLQDAEQSFISRQLAQKVWFYVHRTLRSCMLRVNKTSETVLTLLDFWCFYSKFFQGASYLIRKLF